MSVESLYQAIQALPVAERPRLIERVARETADEFTERAPPARSTAPHRGLGVDVGQATIADDVDDPLPADLQAAFEGGAGENGP